MDRKKIYQMFILGTGELEKPLSEGLGGVILFSKDITSKENLINLINEIKIKSNIPPFISIDQEGGRVERTEYITPKRLSAMYAFEKGENFLKKQTTGMAKELEEYGFNLNFAPCADVNTNPKNPIIGERAFSNNPDEVIKGVKIVSDIYKEHGIIPCIKHFPGHGDANADSHKTLPEINLSMEEMEKYHIKPFKKSIEHGVDMIMAAHLHCTCFDNEIIPTSLSKNALSYLRNNLNFKGIIISDDMVMKGIQYDAGEACIKGINAGLNMFIYREANDISLGAIESVIKEAEKNQEFKHKIDSSYSKIIALKEKYGIIK